MMYPVIREVEPLEGSRIRVLFTNGSCAVVNLKQRTYSMRFSRLQDEALFNSVTTDGMYVIWSKGTDCISVSVNELLDALTYEV